MFKRNIKNKPFYSNSGMALVEIVIAGAIILITTVAIHQAYISSLQYSIANEKNVRAGFVAEEGLEVMTFFRNVDWNNIANLSTTTTYYLGFNSGLWATTTTEQYIDSVFLRKITIGDIMRDGNDDISENGTYDSGIKKVTVSVDYWQGHSTTTKTVSTYLANIYEN